MKARKLKNLSMFQIVAIIIVAMLFIAIVVTAGIIYNLKSTTDDLKNKNSQVTSYCIDESI